MTTTKSTKKSKRSPRGSGRLYKRDRNGKEHPATSTVQGAYWLSYTLPHQNGSQGKRIRQPLRDADNIPITDRKTAEAERDRILAPLQTKNHAETLRVIKARLEDAEKDHSRAKDELSPPPSLVMLWAIFRSSTDAPDCGEAQWKRYQDHHTRFLEWLSRHHEGVADVSNINTEIAREYAQNLKTNYPRVGTYNKHLRYMKLLFRILVAEKKADTNPFQDIRSRKQNEHSRRDLTIDELTAVLGGTEGELQTLLLLGAATGLRLGDCATLEWGEVDLARGLIRRVPNKTKSRKATPVVLGIPPTLHIQLTSLTGQKRGGYVLPKTAEQYLADRSSLTKRIQAHFLNLGIDTHSPGTGQRIVRNKNGEPKRDQNGNVLLENTGKPAFLDVGFHSLRHTYVSMHAHSGTPQAAIQANVGHSNPAMTQHYTHVSEQQAVEYAQRLEVFAGKSGGSHQDREPLPIWALTLVERLDGNTWAKIKAELLRERQQ